MSVVSGFSLLIRFLCEALSRAKKRLWWTTRWVEGHELYRHPHHRQLHTPRVPSSTPFRLPGGFRYEVMQLGMSASVSAYSLAIAESMQELKQVA